MKRMIITPSQLKAINEATDGGEFQNIDQVANQIKSEPTTSSTPTIYTNTNPVQGVEGVTVKKTDVMNGTVDFNNSNAFPSGTPSIKVIPESRFSKRHIERARMLEMYNNGKVYTKRQMNEMFMKSKENSETPEF